MRNKATSIFTHDMEMTKTSKFEFKFIESGSGNTYPYASHETIMSHKFVFGFTSVCRIRVTQARRVDSTLLLGNACRTKKR